jgi:hypothetical protein
MVSASADPPDRPGDLTDDYRRSYGQTGAVRGTATENPVHGRHYRVELRAVDRDEHEDQHGQAQRRHQ